MTTELLAAVGGLALLDSLNPATIIGIALILAILYLVGIQVNVG